MDTTRIIIHEKEILRRAIETYGAEAQMDQLVEECAELIAAINRYHRRRTDIAPVIEELADVAIMLEQMSLVFGDHVALARRIKLLRLMERLT